MREAVWHTAAKRIAAIRTAAQRMRLIGMRLNGMTTPEHTMAGARACVNVNAVNWQIT